MNFKQAHSFPLPPWHVWPRPHSPAELPSPNGSGWMTRSGRKVFSDTLARRPRDRPRKNILQATRQPGTARSAARAGSTPDAAPAAPAAASSPLQSQRAPSPSRQETKQLEAKKKQAEEAEEAKKKRRSREGGKKPPKPKTATAPNADQGHPGFGSAHRHAPTTKGEREVMDDSKAHRRKAARSRRGRSSMQIRQCETERESRCANNNVCKTA